MATRQRQQRRSATLTVGSPAHSRRLVCNSSPQGLLFNVTNASTIEVAIPVEYRRPQSGPTGRAPKQSVLL